MPARPRRLALQTHERRAPKAVVEDADSDSRTATASVPNAGLRLLIEPGTTTGHGGRRLMSRNSDQHQFCNGQFPMLDNPRVAPIGWLL
jgi:hypothetical protein